MTMARPLRAELVDTCRELAARGWVANHDGNITVRLGNDRYLATPTATAKAAVTLDSLLEVDTAGKRVAGTTRPFGEIGMHLGIYAQRADIRAVVHAHPPHATAIACSPGNPISRPFIAEAVVSLGASIPKVPFAMPGPDAARAMAAVAADVDAALLENHGVMAWGATVEQALLRLELVEHLARIALLALPLGGPQPLPEHALPPLLSARARAGLGQAADRAAASVHEPAAALMAAPTAPAHPAPSSPAPGARQAAEDLASIVRDELVRALRQD